jgi:hypothetical protein
VDEVLMRFERVGVFFVTLLATAGLPAAAPPCAKPSTIPQGLVGQSAATLSDLADRREAAIRAELRAGRRELWEGSFYATTGFRGLSTGWIVSRKAGYVSTSRLLDMGTVEATGDRITLVSDFPIKPAKRKFTEYVVVPWGERVYLVQPRLLLSFCNDVNSGSMRSPGETRGLYLLRVKDWERKVSGLPKVPKKYQEYLLKKPISGTIVTVNGPREDVAVLGDRVSRSGLAVTLNVGKRAGVRTGMTFFAEREADRYDLNVFQIVVVSVTAERAELLVVCEDNEKARKRFLSGMRLTTSDRIHQDKEVRPMFRRAIP